MFGSPRRRFIVLKEDGIEWYEDESQARRGSPLGRLELPRGTPAPKLDGKQLMVYTAKATLMLVEIEEGDASEWQVAIESVIKGNGPADDVAEVAEVLYPPQDAAVYSDEPPAWSMAALLSTAGLHDAIADALTSGKPSEQDELTYMRGLDETTVRRLVCGESALPLHAALATKVWTAVAELSKSEAATGIELHDKFRQEGAGFTLAYGGLSTFFGGLERLAGAPDPKLEKALRAEHCERDDSGVEFLTSNYEMTTTSRIEWWFVADPDHGLSELGIPAYPVEKSGTLPAEHMRKPLPQRALRPRLRAANKQLAALEEPPMVEEELLASRLYTGPCFVKYNAVLRAFTKVPMLQQAFDTLCKGNLYTTTLHCINSTVVKASFSPKDTPTHCTHSFTRRMHECRESRSRPRSARTRFTPSSYSSSPCHPPLRS